MMVLFFTLVSGAFLYIANKLKQKDDLKGPRGANPLSVIESILQRTRNFSLNLSLSHPQRVDRPFGPSVQAEPYPADDCGTGGG